MSSRGSLRLDSVSRSFGPVEVIRNLSLDIRPREFVAVVGPSGCGKTTLLNLISGFDPPNQGDVIRNGMLRMIYQQGGLFAWRTAVQNIAMGLVDVKDGQD